MSLFGFSPYFYTFVQSYNAFIPSPFAVCPRKTIDRVPLNVDGKNCIIIMCSYPLFHCSLLRLSCTVLTCPALFCKYFELSWAFLHCPELSCIFSIVLHSLYFPALSWTAIACPAMSCLVMYCPALSGCTVVPQSPGLSLFWTVLTCSAQSCTVLVLPCPSYCSQSYTAMPCPVLSCLF